MVEISKTTRSQIRPSRLKTIRRIMPRLWLMTSGESCVSFIRNGKKNQPQVIFWMIRNPPKTKAGIRITAYFLKKPMIEILFPSKIKSMICQTQIAKIRNKPDSLVITSIEPKIEYQINRLLKNAQIVQSASSERKISSKTNDDCARNMGCRNIRMAASKPVSALKNNFPTK